MNRKLLFLMASGFLFVSILGTLSHFCYEWSGHNTFVGLLCPVSESVWEHIKLLFFPMLLYSFFVIRKTKAAFPCAASGLMSGLLTGCLLIPVLYYTYTGILGYHIAPVDIGIFFVSTAAAFFTAYRLTLSCQKQKNSRILYALVFLLAVLFVYFSVKPPALPLFQPPR